MKIGIFGDSFADASSGNEYCWPKIATDSLLAKGDFYAKSGTSMWWSYEQFKKYYRKYDVIIFSFTSSTRWPCIPEELGGRHFNIGYFKDNTILDTLNPYFFTLFPDEFRKFICRNIHKDVVESCERDSKYLIQVMPFLQGPGEKIPARFDFDPIPNKFPMISALDTISHLEELSYQGKRHKTGRLLSELSIDDHRGCHLNRSNNLVVSEWIGDCIREQKLNIHLECEKNMNMWTIFDQHDSDKFNRELELRKRK